MAIIRSGHIHFYADFTVTCYILRGEKSDLLIDTGFIGIWPGLLCWLRNYQVSHVLLTHAHMDHDWNAKRMQEESAQILLSIHDRELRNNFSIQPVHAVFPKEKQRVRMQNFGASFMKSRSYEPDIWIHDDQPELLKTLGFDAELIPLPGHTLGSVGVLSGDVLYCGDAFTMLNGVPEIPPTAFSPVLMARSLETILKLPVKWLACGHGLPVKMRDARPVIIRYLKEHT